MSDTADDDDAGEAAGDDGGFDKEAEREKLREKYERDKKRREATQQMSDLLLKGATMTNAHCEECGSPIFRMDGERFCPSCGGTRETEEDDADTSAGDRQPDTREPSDDPEGSTTQTGPATSAAEESGGADETASVPGRTLDDVRAASGGRGGDTGGGSPGEDPANGDGAERPAQGQSLDSDDGGGLGGGGAAPRRRRGPEPHEASVEEAPSLAQAKASLRRAIVSLSEQAAQSDEPVHAKELLEAAGEATKALSELQD